MIVSEPGSQVKVQGLEAGIREPLNAVARGKVPIALPPGPGAEPRQGSGLEGGTENPWPFLLPRPCRRFQHDEPGVLN